MNGEIRDREKVMQGLKRPDTPIRRGYQVFHNYIRPHSALGGKTPADACGITVEGEKVDNHNTERKPCQEGEGRGNE